MNWLRNHNRLFQGLLLAAIVLVAGFIGWTTRGISSQQEPSKQTCYVSIEELPSGDLVAVLTPSPPVTTPSTTQIIQLAWDGQEWTKDTGVWTWMYQEASAGVATNGVAYRYVTQSADDGADAGGAVPIMWGDCTRPT